MARLIHAISADNAPDFVTAVNTFLATLTNPTLVQVSWTVTTFDHRVGTQYRAVISYDTGGAALGTPFLIRVDENQNLDLATADVQTFVTANAGYFILGARLFYNDNGIRLPKYSLITLYNTTGGASANYAAL